MSLVFKNRAEQLDYVIGKFITFLNKVTGSQLSPDKKTINLVTGECIKYIPEFKKAINENSIDIIIDNIKEIRLLFPDIDDLKEKIEKTPWGRQSLFVYIDTLVKILDD